MIEILVFVQLYNIYSHITIYIPNSDCIQVSATEAVRNYFSRLNEMHMSAITSLTIVTLDKT